MSNKNSRAGLPQTAIGKVNIKAVGVGGGGSNAVSRMFRDRVPEVEYIAINTDAQALQNCKAPIRLRVGDLTARGLGVGGDAAKGRSCHEENREEIAELLEGADLVFIATGMGGGTGTGGSPVIAQVAKESGALVVGVVTKPFEFEGPKRARIASEGINAISKFVDTLIVIPNERLLQMSDADIQMDVAYRMADDILRQGIQSISELILNPGDINLDFADLKSVMKSAGQAWMAIGTGHGENRAIEAAQQAIQSPLLEVSIEGAKGVLLNFTGSPDMKLAEIQEATDYIKQIVAEEAEIFFGTKIDKKMDNEIQITVIATGFPSINNPDDVLRIENTVNMNSGINLDTLETPPHLRKHEETPTQ